jgi:hypothetical protein
MERCDGVGDDAEGWRDGCETCLPIYQHEGFLFAMHDYCGPQKLRGDLSPAAAMGRRFWAAWSEWDQLSPAAKAATKIIEQNHDQPK